MRSSTPLCLLAWMMSACGGAFSAIEPEAAQRDFAYRVADAPLRVDPEALADAAVTVLKAAGFAPSEPIHASWGWSIYAGLTPERFKDMQLGLKWRDSYTDTLGGGDALVSYWIRDGLGRLRTTRTELHEYRAEVHARISHLPKYEHFTEADPYLTLAIIARVDPDLARQLWRHEPTGQTTLRCALLVAADKAAPDCVGR